jgi:MmgE/PrpD N-terminal domain
VTTTDEILALAASAAGAMAAGSPVWALTGAAVTVTEADVTAFRAAAARGSGSAVVRALLAVRPAVAPAGPPTAHPASPTGTTSGDPAWTAWLTAAAAVAGGQAVEGEETGATGEERAAVVPLPVWCAVLGAATALADAPGLAPAGGTVAAASTAGLAGAALVESGLHGWGGWSSGSVAAVIGAGLTAGLLLGLDDGQLRAAIGICATQAAGLRAADGTDAFPLQVGKAAFNGVEAALLARAGLTAPAEPLDGRRGLFALFGS